MIIPSDVSGSRMAMKRVVILLLIVLVSWAYQATRPPPPRVCGSHGGPPVTAPRIRLRDGRHLAYKEYGVPRELAKYKIISVHGFSSSRHDAVFETALSKVLQISKCTYIYIYIHMYVCISLCEFYMLAFHHWVQYCISLPFDFEHDLLRQYIGF